MISLELEARLDNLLCTAQAETADIDLLAPLIITEREECPICLLPLPIEADGNTFFPCCGKRICNGCVFRCAKNDANKGIPENKQKCALCCQTTPKNLIKALKKLMKKNYPEAFLLMAKEHRSGEDGVIQSNTKSLEMYIRAAELGNAGAYTGIGIYYEGGFGVELDRSKALEFYEVAAKKGSIEAHRQLAELCGRIGEIQISIEHRKVAARSGHKESMDTLMNMYKDKLLSKEELTQTLRSFHASSNEMKSRERDEAHAYLQQS